MGAVEPEAAARFAVEGRAVVGALFETPADAGLQARARVLATMAARLGRWAPAVACAAVPAAADQAAHALRVAVLAAAIGDRLGLGEDSCAALAFAGLVHDLGKALLPGELGALGQRGLDEAGQALWEQHPELSLGLIIGHGPIEALARDAIVAHHERLDGRGHPYALVGDAVPLGGRVLAVADAYDVLMRRPAAEGRRAPGAAVAVLRGPLAAGLDGAAVEALGALVEGEGVDGCPAGA
ncbi:MAG: HD domain-containing protein [bacterium]|nr:HD domain-containing protein [Myxococcales bacterium]MCB9552668.1 HD domain-containing protein [Myxococcales bacterium]